MRRFVVGFALLLLGFAAPAAAHDRSSSYSSWRLHGRSAQVTLRLSALELTRLHWLAAADADRELALGAYAASRLRLFAGEVACAVDGVVARAATPGRELLSWSVTCPPEGALAIRSALLHDVAPGHLHFVDVALEGRRLERLLTARESAWQLPQTSQAEPHTTPLGVFVRVGLEHIATGHDHLVFLCTLLLLGGTWARAAAIVTAFTVAHSLTLATAVLGYLRPSSAAVEALIGLSIALVAAENVWLVGERGAMLPRVSAAALLAAAGLATAGHGALPALTLVGAALFVRCYFELLRCVHDASGARVAIAFLFGLVHGFGFAGALAEAALPRADLALALFGFNVGVELGQLAVVAALWPLLRLIARHRPALSLHLLHAGSALGLGLGVFWFVTRAA